MNIKKLTILVLAFAVIVISFSVYNFISGIGKDVVNIVAAPRDTTLLLDNKTTIKTGKHKLTTGTHIIKATRKGFEDQIKEFTTINSKENDVWFEMIANTQEGREYANTHQSEYEKVYSVANKHASAITDKKVLDYPLIKKLPANLSPLFVINYGQSKKHPNDSSKIAIYITADKPDAKNSALSYIFSLGYDPSDYEIVFETSGSTSQIEGTGVGDDYGDSGMNYPNESFEGYR